MPFNYLVVKLTQYINTLKTEHIMAAALIYQGLEENSISKEELRDVVNKAVSSVQKSITDHERLNKLSKITPQVSY